MAHFLNRIITSLSFFVILAAMSISQLKADDLTVEQYCELTIARIQLVEDTLRYESRSLNNEDEELLWQLYGTTSSEYYSFAGTHRAELDAYLGTNPQISDEIDAIGARVDALIEQQGDSQ